MSQRQMMTLSGNIEIETQNNLVEIVPDIKDHVIECFRNHFHNVDYEYKVPNWTLEMSKCNKMLEVTVVSIEINGISY